MDMKTGAVANRAEPIPQLRLGTHKHDSHEATPATPTSSLAHTKHGENSGSPSHSLSAVQDRLFARIFQQIIPHEEHEGTQNEHKPHYSHLDRPGFSLPTMTSNLRKFIQRVGPVFVVQHQAIHLLTWQEPTHTLSVLAVYSFCVLNLTLLTALPLVMAIGFIMVPAYIARHPPPSDSLSPDGYEVSGPATAKAPVLRPAPEASKDFFRNLRDLQNSLEDFVVAHDSLVDNVVPLTNFSNERLSSGVYVALSLAVSGITVASVLLPSVLPWRLIFVGGGWGAIASLHPVARDYIKKIDTRPLQRELKRRQGEFKKWAVNDIVLDATPEVREVEIFELQRRNGEEWDAWLFAISPYTPRSPLRVSGDRPRGTRFFEDVQPPPGWVWKTKKWNLDLQSHEWVEARMITAIEVEVEGEHWVYDVSDEELNAQSAEEQQEPDEEQLDAQESLERIGEWRRRRWVRQVQRTAGDVAAG